ncbi:lysophospholipid acyltransferase family protein [Brevundimonas sp. VNH65]|uniref:lysophospholipid acyltransferase family protein n=1 Tax=Brevundimonas sp. VNH65 TaxID=3400917 RepID=UPI003C07E62F
MRPLRNPVIQTVMANLLAGWMRFCVATIRWTRENEAVAEQVWADGGPVICVFWHSRISLTPACWPHHRAQEVRAIVSLSPDGQFIARAMGKVGFPSIRGSSANKDKADRAKGGSAALRDALRQLKVGGVALTPDGPRGPMRQMGDGLAVMAKLSGAPVLFIGLSCNPAIRLGSWDRAILPLPFGKGAIVWDIDRYPDDAAPSDVAPSKVALAWTDRLTAVEARADELTGLERL